MCIRDRLWVLGEIPGSMLSIERSCGPWGAPSKVEAERGEPSGRLGRPPHRPWTTCPTPSHRT
eukprot:4652458-Amphidinium_carterae.1